MEQKVLTEFMKMYREQTLLWDSSHRLYTNKVARKRALDVLFEKYKEVDSFADMRRMRKKIENLRTTYKRERSKVIKARMTGELYEPTLWYYPLLSFLDEQRDPNQNDTTESEQNVTTINDDEDADDDDENESFSLECTETPSPLPSKRSKPTSVYINESNDNDFIIEPSTKVKRTKSVYVEENDNLFQEEPSCSVKHEPSEVYLGVPNTESDLYAKTISAQLNELRPKQRYIAEKLISDIIFYGRLDKLKTGTSLNLNNDI